MNKLTAIALSFLTLCSCTIIEAPKPEPDNLIRDRVLIKEIPTYEQEILVKNVNHYAKWLVQDLFSHIDIPNNNSAFAVANFALLDSDLKKTNHFGRQLNEAIMHETSRIGFSVFDLKSTGRLQFTNTGDIFWHSEQIDELTGELNIDYVITGTMTKHQGGYLLNARIIDVTTNILLSSAQSFAPADVVDAVLRETPKNSEGFPIISSSN